MSRLCHAPAASGAGGHWAIAIPSGARRTLPFPSSDGRYGTTMRLLHINLPGLIYTAQGRRDRSALASPLGLAADPGLGSMLHVR